MDLYSSPLWISDLDETLNALPELDELSGKSVFITGATGLICSALTDILIRYNETSTGKIRIFAGGRDSARAAARFGRHMNAGWFSFVPYDSLLPVDAGTVSFDYVIHGAGNATPDRMLLEPVETMLSNFLGVRNLLELLRSAGKGRLAYVSSSEVYGTTGGTDPISPDKYGAVDPLKVRSCYPEGKKAAETLCASYAEEFGVDSVIVRPGHVYGPTASPSDTRVSSAWAFDAAAGRDIVMKSEGAQIRSYCYCVDCASAIITAMLRGERCRAYNISNPDSVLSIRDMAGILASCSGTRIVKDYPDKAEKTAFNPMNNSSLDASELLGLGWSPLFSADRGFSHTLQIMREAGLV